MLDFPRGEFDANTRGPDPDIYLRSLPGHPLREDYHGDGNGTQVLFLFFNPYSGWRRVSCRDSCTRIDGAQEIRQLLLVDYPHAKKIKLVCDNLNTHSVASLSEAFTTADARRKFHRPYPQLHPRQGGSLVRDEMHLAVIMPFLQLVALSVKAADRLSVKEKMNVGN